MARATASTIVIQVVPRRGKNAHMLLRKRVTNEARTWLWSNKAKTRIKHINSGGYIQLGNAEGVLVARIFTTKPGDLFFLTEKFIGRLVAWFEADLAAVNVQFIEPVPRTK